MSYVLPTAKVLPKVIVAGTTQGSIPLLRQNEGSTEPSIVFVDGSGNPLTGLDLVGTVAPDTSPGDASFSISAGTSVPPTQYIAAVIQNGVATDALEFTVTAPPPPPPPPAETDVIGDLTNLPPAVPYTA